MTDEKLPVGREMVILEQLMAAGGKPKFGLEIVRDAPKGTLHRNSIYVLLTRMVARGLLASRLETDEEQPRPGPRRRLYWCTDYGAQQYRVRRAADAAAEAERQLSGVPKPQGAM